MFVVIISIRSNWSWYQVDNFGFKRLHVEF